jgi:hypothetical protein
MRTPNLPKLLAFAVVACALGGCAASPASAVEPPAAPLAVQKENTWTVQSPQPKWWLEQPPCPDGGKVVGAPPPHGQVLECVSDRGVVHGFSSVWFPDGHEGTLTEYRAGVRNGRFLYWLHNHPLVEGTFKDGRRSGTWTHGFDGQSGFDMEARFDRAYNAKNYPVETYNNGLLVSTVNMKDGVPSAP